MKNTVFLVLLLWLSISNAVSQNGIYNVKEFGAISDGTTLSTNAIQLAINKCAEQGGGKVIVPPRKYLPSSLFLKSNITFEVFPGTTFT